MVRNWYSTDFRLTTHSRGFPPRNESVGQDGKQDVIDYKSGYVTYAHCATRNHMGRSPAQLCSAIRTRVLNLEKQDGGLAKSAGQTKNACNKKSMAEWYNRHHGVQESPELALGTRVTVHDTGQQSRVILKRARSTRWGQRPQEES